MSKRLTLKTYPKFGFLTQPLTLNPNFGRVVACLNDVCHFHGYVGMYFVPVACVHTKLTYTLYVIIAPLALTGVAYFIHLNLQ